ncbi:sulfate permease family protein [Janthinobacterium agaricidamnosum NBRC 102515 = DSM 9628]|uniref:Sulfate permease family protein n=2 Tax=Janthinobacterium agaricidamnosum TaxID=55508 RepID=W0V846_9BURK|nr:sulfate permease family protein [Janthinobacterium agaricidamnosum NBRC 102515 = DSM 9628]
MLAGDITAGIVVAMMMIPQGMAYALVAGLPPVVGIYASILPPILYSLFGSSMTQSVGPMAIVALMTAAALAPLADPGSTLYVVLAAQLALISGLVLLLCGILRLGFMASFLSRPVISGFSNGAAIVIVVGQIPSLLGASLPHWHGPSAALGLASLLLLWLAKHYLGRLLRRCGCSAAAADTGARLAPMLLVLGSTVLVGWLDLSHAGVAVTGNVPAGLPSLNLASSSQHWRALLSPALLIAFIVFLMSMSAAQTLAQKRGEKLRTNHELLGLGAANVASALSGGFPVTGSISRSAVNFSAGANTPLASIISAILLALALVAPTGWLAMLPLPVLAATIVFAVSGLLDWDTLKKAWRYDRSDALALLATTAGVLVLGVEAGVVIGVLLSMGTLIWRASRPHIAVLGRIPGSEHYRNVERYQAETWPEILLLRIDAGLFFGNVDAVNDKVEEELLARPATRHLVLVLSAVNQIDSTALFGLLELNRALSGRGIRLHLAEVKGPVMDRLRQSKLLQELSGKVYLSTALASADLHPALTTA